MGDRVIVYLTENRTKFRQAKRQAGEIQFALDKGGAGASRVQNVRGGGGQ